MSVCPSVCLSVWSTNQNHIEEPFLRLPGTQVFPAIYAACWTTSVFTTAHHCSLSRIILIESMPFHPIFKFHFNIILPYIFHAFQIVLPITFLRQNLICIFSWKEDPISFHITVIKLTEYFATILYFQKL
jgi:hypothetical protein